MTLVSVVIPCYNGERYVGQAIASACGRGDVAVDVVVADDGSTDRSARIAARYAGPVRSVRGLHRGIGAARNAGVAAARGDVLAFLDADDLWAVGSLRRRLDALLADPSLDYVTGLVEQFISPDTPDDTRRTLGSTAGPSRGRLAGTIVIRRAAFDRVGPFDASLRVGETLDWLDRADHLGLRHRVLAETVLYRRLHGANTGASAPELRAEYLRMLKGTLDRRRAGGAVAALRATGIADHG